MKSILISDNYKLGSLFDGSGGFPLAGALCGIEPVWASEVEPYPIAVTRSRFPNMKHLGDISKVNGAEIEPVDIITFGSPCQDLSVAGKRAGLKHEANGDEETTRSGLFMEAVRIIKEMRKATNGEYPTFVLWENVPGAVAYIDTSRADDVVRTDEVVAPLQARDYKGGKLIQSHYIVRRLTPTECARLQGFADWWGDIEEKDSFTDEEYKFWLEVRNTHAAINGKKVQDYTVKQMLTWYNKLHTDSAEYKMWGNGIALPPALYCLQGIVEVLNRIHKEVHI